MSAGDKLPPKRRAFVQAYVGPARWNGAEAYRQAGYQCNGPSVARTEAVRLLADHSVDDYLDELIAESGIAKKLSPEVIKAGIYKAFEVAKDKGDIGNMLRAWEMLGRAYAMFKDVSRSEDATTDALLTTIKGSVPDETLADLAEQHGIDPESLGLSRH